MGVGKKKKAPITRDGSESTSLSSKKTKEIINKFHQLLKRRNITTDEKLKRQIDGEIDSLGGMSVYQHASTLGQSATRGGDSSHVFVAWLQELRVKEELQRGDKMRWVLRNLPAHMAQESLVSSKSAHSNQIITKNNVAGSIQS